MFRKLYNLAELSGHLEPDGPVLVAQGGGALDPLAPDLAFVRAHHRDRPTVYLPGASLKGVFRAHGERLLATWIDPRAAESPFAKIKGGSESGEGDGERIETAPRRQKAHDARDAGDRPEVFRVSCEADRLFGSTEIAGRLRIGDAYPTPETVEAANRTEVRYGVAIDRAKQSVRVGPFEQEAVTAGSFALKVTLENFDLWMLALLLQVLRDLDAGLIQVGHAKSRGFGTMKVGAPVLRLLYPGPAPARIEGAGAREAAAEVRAAYGLEDDDHAEAPAGATPVGEGLLSGFRVEGWEALSALQDGLRSGWDRFVERAKAEAGGDHAA